MMDQAAILRRLKAKIDESIDNPSIFTRSDIIAVCSGKGGVGKTNTAVNLALTLKKQKQDVLLIDADLGLSNVDVVLGVHPEKTMKEVIYNNLPVEDAIIDGPSGLRILSASSGVKELAELDEGVRTSLLSRLKKLNERFDSVIIDIGAGIGSNVLFFLSLCDKVIIVTTPEPTAITDAYAVIKVMKAAKVATKMYLLVNMARNGRDARDTYDRLNIVVKTFLGTSLLYCGYIVYDKAVKEAVQARNPFCLSNPESRAAQCVHNIARLFIPAGVPAERGL